MDEQLSMFGQSTPSKPISDESLPLKLEIPEDDEYEALDYQLADLMVELNDFKPEDKDERKALDKVLRQCTLDISKRTREGKISVEISAEQQTALLQTTVVGKAGEYMPLIIESETDQGYLYLNRYWQYQQRLANQINMRIKSKESISEEQQEWAQSRLLDYFPSDETDDQMNWQKRAAELALENRFLIVSGGPGTGKTTTITRLLALLIEQKFMPERGGDVFSNNTSTENANINEVNALNNNSKRSLSILLAAPTGKAAIRMLDSMREVNQSLQTELGLDESILAQMPTQANTIHKLLGYKHNSAQFKHNRNNPLHADVILVDEASMIDIALMSKLVDAVPDHAKLILIGDKDQLSSVETGSVFADMCQGLDASYVDVFSREVSALDDDELDEKALADADTEESKNTFLVTLRKNWRFSKDSDIGQCAIAANQGDSKILLSVLKDPSRHSAELIQPSNLRDSELIKPWQHYFSVLNNPDSSLSEIFTAFNQYRILNALRRGYNGSEVMNDRIETALKKQGLITRHRGSAYYHGRPIMITQNSYNRGLFNGDTGITLIRDGEIEVFFPATDGEFISFSPVRLPAHETTWAMTIHKSQGSEFDQVVLILPQEKMPLLTRQLVYTGITRAKETVSIVASEAVLVSGVRAEVVRATRTGQLLKKA